MTEGRLQYCIPGTDIDFRNLKTTGVRYGIGGRILIKELPDYPLFECTQKADTDFMACQEFATYLIMIFSANEGDDVACTLCKEHTDRLLMLQKNNVPVSVVQ